MSDERDPSRCKAKSSRSGKPCKRRPMRGQAVCATHGGKAPQNLAAAERRMDEVRAANAVEAFGLPREIDPWDELIEEVYRTADTVNWLHAQILELAPDDIIWGKAEETEKTATEKSFPPTRG